MIDGDATAGKAIEEVLAALNVVTVVCIDDIYGLDDGEESAAVAIAWTEGALSGGREGECDAAWRPVLSEMPSFKGPAEVWKRQLRSAWEKLSPEQRAAALHSLGGILERGGDLPGDQRVASLLRHWMPPTVHLRELAPAQWEERQSALFGEIRGGERLLCLFDHNLEAAEGYGASQGVQLMDAAIDARGELPVICGLLTHTVSEGEEIEKAKQLADELGRNRKDFLVLSKKRLRDPSRFAHGLQMMVLNHTRDDLTALVEGLFSEASTQASDDLRELDIYDFNYMVLRSSEREGVSEAETLIRLFDVFRHRAFRRATLTSPASDALGSAIHRVRHVRAVTTVPDPDVYPRGQRWDIRRLELYEDADSINLAHLPIELGDIFRVGTRILVLVGQPCDLMVRENGERSASVLTLLNITPNPPSPGFGFALDYFDPKTGGRLYVKFRSPCYISGAVLDLAAFNPEGRCSIDLDGDLPSVLHPPWATRFLQLRNRFGVLMERFSEITRLVSTANLSQECRQFLMTSLVTQITRSNVSVLCNYADDVLEFRARRIDRYRQPGALGLLADYHSFLSRHADAHDYTPPRMLGDGVWECPPGQDCRDAAFVGAKNSVVFHTQQCGHARLIAAEALVCFDSDEDAIAYGRNPCARCRPSDGAGE